MDYGLTEKEISHWHKYRISARVRTIPCIGFEHFLDDVEFSIPRFSAPIELVVLPRLVIGCKGYAFKTPSSMVPNPIDFRMLLEGSEG